MNNYKVNNKPFRVIDNRLFFDENEFEITSSFVTLFIKNKENYKHLTYDERTALPLFIKHAGGLKSDRKSNLYNTVKYWENQYEDSSGNGVSYAFLSCDPNILVQRLEILIVEYFAGNKNSISEAEAILKELLNQNEINDTQYKNTMKFFTT